MTNTASKIIPETAEEAKARIHENQEKIRILKETGITNDTISELLFYYEEIRWLVKNFNVEPESLFDYLSFMRKHHLYAKGIELGRWLEDIFQSIPNPDESDERNLGAVKIYLGNLLSDTNRIDEAERYYQEALEIWRRLAKENPAAFEPDLAGTCNNLGNLLSDTNRMDEAERYYQEALEIRRRLAKENPAAFEPDLATTCYNLGLFEWRQNHRSAAKAYFQEALALYKKFPYQVKRANNTRRALHLLKYWKYPRKQNKREQRKQSKRRGRRGQRKKWTRRKIKM